MQLEYIKQSQMVTHPRGREVNPTIQFRFSVLTQFHLPFQGATHRSRLCDAAEPNWSFADRGSRLSCSDLTVSVAQRQFSVKESVDARISCLGRECIFAVKPFFQSEK
eukprot:gb/GEZJ01000161.1/.p2 GENE.gb/GEZJ01000161.1/~~gb/GEZJ01000161.1/.p2  ORF type:complete len:108 (+),score=8.51 gb/GEZJ01000161.1/:416-739(+)